MPQIARLCITVIWCLLLVEHTKSEYYEDLDSSDTFISPSSKEDETEQTVEKYNEPTDSNYTERQKRTFGWQARPGLPNKGNQYGNPNPNTNINRPSQNTNSNTINNKRPGSNTGNTNSNTVNRPPSGYRPRPKAISSSGNELNAPYPQQAPYPSEAPYPKEEPYPHSDATPVLTSDINIRRAIPYENDHINRLYGSRIYVPPSIKIMNEHMRNLGDNQYNDQSFKPYIKKDSRMPSYKNIYSSLTKKLLNSDMYSPSYSYMYDTKLKDYTDPQKVYNDELRSNFQPLVYLPWWLQPENKQYSPFSAENVQSGFPTNREVQPSASAWWLHPSYRPFSNSNQSNIANINRQSPTSSSSLPWWIQPTSRDVQPSASAWWLHPSYRPFSNSNQSNVGNINRQSPPSSLPWWIQPKNELFSPFSTEALRHELPTNRDAQPPASAWWLHPNNRPFSNSNKPSLVNINRQALPSPVPWWLQPGSQPFSSSSQSNIYSNTNRHIAQPVSPPWWLQQTQQFRPADFRGEALFSPPAGGGPSSGFNVEVSEIAEPAFIIPETVEKVDVTIPPPFAPLRTHGLTINDGDLSRSEVRKDNGEFVSSFTSSDGTSRSDRGSLVPTADGKDSVLVLKGSYSFTTPEGLKFRVDYTADETGYHAKQYPVVEVDS